MAEYKFTAALNPAEVPPVTRFQPRSIMMGQLDNRLKSPSSNNTTNLENNPADLPQIVFMQNVMPSSDGINSVNFQTLTPDTADLTYDNVFTLRDATENRWFFSPAQGENAVSTDIVSGWTTFGSGAIPLPITEPFSMAYVNGVTYICYAHTLLWHWDGAVFVDDSAALTHIAVADIKCIFGSGNYLLAVTDDNVVHWSSLTDPVDFVPNTATGAGEQTPVDIRGAIFYGSPMSGGFILHCQENAVAGVYTNNAAAPWIFREVKGSDGLDSGDSQRITKEVGAGFIYMYNNSGLQQMNLREAENIHASVNDFLASRVIESFDPVTLMLSIAKSASALSVKLSYLCNRYLCISYSTTSGLYTTALIYDSLLKRWGKLYEDHVDIFSIGIEPNSLCMLRRTGQVKRIVLDRREFQADAVVILGRYQINRTFQICCQQIELELLDDSEDVEVFVATNYNGTTVGAIVPMIENENSDNYRCFQQQVEGENLSFIIRGTFTMPTALITATRGARF